MTHSAGLNLLQTLLVLGPVSHNGFGTQLRQTTCHLFLLVVRVAANVSNDRNAGADSAEGAALAVLDRDGLFGFATANIEGMVIDGRVRLGGGFSERSSGAEDEVWIDVLVLADLLDGCLETTGLQCL